MPYSIEQNMIRILENCIRTSSLRTAEHERIAAKGWVSLELFSSEAWGVRTRNEAVSHEKREILKGLISQLKGSHGFHIALGEALNRTFNSDAPTTIVIASEINTQISQFAGLQVILRENKQRIENTVGIVTAAGGESLKAVTECETLLEAAIASWISQMQQDKLHESGVFPRPFLNTATNSAGTIFEQYVRELIATKTQIPTTELFDSSRKGSQQPALITSLHASGVFESASIRGKSPEGALPIPKEMKDMETQTVDVPSAPPAALSTMVGTPVLLGKRPGYTPPPPPRGNPPPYYEPQYDHLATVFEEGPQPQYYIDPGQVQKPFDPAAANGGGTGMKHN